MAKLAREIAMMLLVMFAAVSTPLLMCGCETDENPVEETQDAIEDTADEAEDAM